MEDVQKITWLILNWLVTRIVSFDLLHITICIMVEYVFRLCCENQSTNDKHKKWKIWITHDEIRPSGFQSRAPPDCRHSGRDRWLSRSVQCCGVTSEIDLTGQLSKFWQETVEWGFVIWCEGQWERMSPPCSLDSDLLGRTCAKYVKLLRISFYVQLSACRPLSNYALIFNLKRKHNTTTTTTTQHIKGKQTKTLYY